MIGHKNVGLAPLDMLPPPDMHRAKCQIARQSGPNHPGIIRENSLTTKETTYNRRQRGEQRQDKKNRHKNQPRIGYVKQTFHKNSDFLRKDKQRI